MIKVFNSPFNITQKFGINPQIYKKWGLNGHEGLDLVPTTSDWTVFSLPYKGKVVKDVDMKEKGGNYGNHTTIWYPDIEEAWMYIHLSSNKVYEGQEIDPSTNIGTMGATGNTTGAHLHLNRFKVDARGYRLNKTNGFLGGIDPLTFLQKDIGLPVEEQEDEYKLKGIKILDEYRNVRKAGPEGNWEGYANAIIGSDRDIIELTAKVAENDLNREELENSYKEELDIAKKELKNTYDTDKKILESVWQRKVESAKVDVLKKSSYSTLVNAFFSKLFKKGGENKND